MNKLKLWLLKKLIAEAVRRRRTDIIMENLWASCRHTNIFDAYDYIMGHVDYEFRRELDALPKPDADGVAVKVSS